MVAGIPTIGAGLMAVPKTVSFVSHREHSPVDIPAKECSGLLPQWESPKLTYSPHSSEVVWGIVLQHMYGCESWTVKKAEHQRIDALELWCWRRLLRVPWTARRSNQSILKEISPGISLEGMMLKLKL